MRRPYLEVTFRKSKALAAYAHLPRPSGAKIARSDQRGPGLVVDFAPNGEPVGIEITAPTLVDLAAINRLLADRAGGRRSRASARGVTIEFVR